MTDLVDCRICHNRGWTLDANDADAAYLFFVPCPGPECQQSGKSFEWLDVKEAQFVDVKKDGDIVTHLSKYVS